MRFEHCLQPGSGVDVVRLTGRALRGGLRFDLEGGAVVLNGVDGFLVNQRLEPVVLERFFISGRRLRRQERQGAAVRGRVNFLDRRFRLVDDLRFTAVERNTVNVCMTVF